MELRLHLLNYDFLHQPLVIGGKAMEYYGLRKAGEDSDLVIHPEDHAALLAKYPDHVKDLYGDIGVCEFGFEIWNQICMFDYDHLRTDALAENDYLIISLEKLLFLKAIAMHIPKCHEDLQLIVGLVLKRAYGKA
jgi:hypothetical protein